MKIKRLSARMVATATPGRYCDGGGLWLVIRNGRRNWTFRYHRDGRARTMGLGPVATVSLADARERARKARELLLDGVDPIEARRADRGKRRNAITFRQATALYIATHGGSWRNPKHRAQWTNTLETYAWPIIGDVLVGKINTAAVLKVLEPIWQEKPETASRLRGRVERVLDWAAVRGDRAGENPARWKGHLQALLPAKARAVKHHAALHWGYTPDFMADLRMREGIGARALEFAILTAARSGEARGATWGELDLDAALWTVPACRMKARKQHRVPLAGRALAILRDMRALSDGEPGSLIFPGMKPGKPLSDMSLTAVLRRMGRDDCTTHGFRSAFRDWAAESTGFPREVAEQALAHAIGDKVEAAYRRGDLIEKRGRLMEAWAGFCERPAVERGNVRPLRA